MAVVYVAIAVVVVLLIAVAWTFNRLVQLRNQKDNAWSQIDVQLKRRHDLIPNLVETVRGYAKHEREVLEYVAKARGSAVAAQGVEQQARAENMLTRALGQLRVAVENYPDLKASRNFLALQEELTSTENKIAFARQFYNDTVMRLNTKIQMFPSNIIAGMFNFKQAPFFEIEDPAARHRPDVKFAGGS